MKNVLIYLCLAAFISHAYCDSAYGYPSVTVRGFDGYDAADNLKVCLLTLTYQVTPSKIIFKETIKNPNQYCAFQNLTFKPLFWLDQAVGTVDLIQDPNNSSQWIGELTLAKFQANNGSGCYNVQQFTGGNAYYICRFAYGWNKLFEMLIGFLPATNQFYQIDNAFIPLHQATVFKSENGTTVWAPGDTSVTDIVGMLYKDCDPNTWSTQIPSGNNAVYVTGTHLAGPRDVNLQTIFSNILMFSVTVRKRNSAKSDYRTHWVVNYAFNGAPANGVCSDIGRTYSQIVGGDMSYCSGGCDVSFYMQGIINGGYYTSMALRTSGFTYVPPALRS